MERLQLRALTLRALLLFVPALTPLTNTAGAGETRGASLTAPRRYETAVTPADNVVCVGESFLRAGSDTLSLDGRRLERGRDYDLDDVQGCIILRAEAFGESLSSAPRRLVVRYAPLPLGLRPLYVRRDLDAPPPRVTASAPADTAVRRFPADWARAATVGGGERPELRVAGSKTLAFDLGSNRDLSLRQTLDLRVEGALSSDVRLRALLSDRNLPFQPEGNTAELEELDRILIEVEAPDARVGLGDQDLSVQRGALLRFSRRLQGLALAGRGGPAALDLVAAAQRGEFQSFEFLGTDGKQGPYPVTDRLGGRGVVVVAGSERVWLDGEELKRGVDLDYTIDYGRAELTFTPRRLITAQSRIAVDYEYSAYGYRRSLVRGGLESRRPGPFRWSFDWVRETDDPERPLSGSLTDADRAQLEAAGDEPISTGSGIRLVGEGEGRYRQAFDTSASRTYYEYVGARRGNYEIVFVRLGAGLGDYADSLAGVDTVYVYRGANNGAFAPAGGLTQPAALGIVQSTARWTPVSGVTAELEGALSRKDLNRLSTKDDDDNDGAAGRGRVVVAPRPFTLLGRRLGRVDLDLDFRRLAPGFATPGRLDDVFVYDRDWNLPRRGETGAESRGQLLLGWRPSAAWRLSGEAGRIGGAGLEARRGLLRLERIGATTLNADLLRGDSEVDTAGFEGRLERESLRTGTRWRGVAPRLFGEREERVDPLGGRATRYRSGGGELRVEPRAGWYLSAGADGRDDDARSGSAGEWLTVSRAVTRRVGVGLAASSRFQLAGSWQSRHLTRPESGEDRTDLATLDATQRSDRSEVVSEFHGRLATTGVERRSRTLVFVGEGEGNFDAFGNAFPGGGYDLEEGAPGDEEVTADLDVALRFEVNPHRGDAAPGETPAPWWRRALGWRGDARLQELSRLPLGSPGRLFAAASYQNPASTIRGRQQLRQQLDILPLLRTATFILRQELDDIANYQFTNFREDRRESIVGIGLRSTPLPPLTLELEQKGGNRRQEVVAGTAPTARRAARVRETRGSLIWRPTTELRLNCDITRRSETSTSGSGSGRALDVAPRVSWLPTPRSRVDLVGRWIEARRSDGYTGIGGFASFFLQDRVELGIDGDLRLGEVVTVGAGLTGRRLEGSDTVLDGRMEVRAYF